MTSRRRFFPGGCRGLEPGEPLLPASVTGVASVSGAAGAPHRRDRIYLADTVEEARSYAALYIPPLIVEALAKREQITVDDLGGDLYEVEVSGEVIVDGDYSASMSTRSWEATAARVVRVLERGVSPDLSLLDDI